MRINFKAGALAALAFASLAGAAHASTITLTLGGLHTGDFLDNYYDGGFGSTTNTGTVLNVGPGPNLGFTFSPNADVQSAGHSSSTGNGKFENNPSGQSQILYFSNNTTTNPSVMDFAVGFDSFSFNYSFSGNSSANDGETVSIWSGLNGTGSLLDTLSLNAATQAVSCTSSFDAYCTWMSITASGFKGAESAVFGPNSQTLSTEFDGLQLTPSAVPLPAAGWLLLSGLIGMGAASRRRPTAA